MSLPPRILYVDDDLADCEMMAYWLREECGYDVSAAVDGRQAIALIETEFFDLFLLDYCLPDTTAVHLCDRIRRVNLEAPIIIYSALDREIDRQRAFAAGADYYLVKPDQIHLIEPHLKMLLGKTRPDRLPASAHKVLEETRPIVHNIATPKRKASGIV